MPSPAEQVCLSLSLSHATDLQRTAWARPSTPDPFTAYELDSAQRCVTRPAVNVPVGLHTEIHHPGRGRL